MELIIKQTLSKTKAVDFVYEVLKSNILEWKLLPGERLAENDVADKLDVSRNTVREAMRRLCLEGLLEVKPQRGSFVTQLNLEKDDDLRFMRASMECALLREAIEEERFMPLHIKMLENSIELQKQAVERREFQKFCDYDEKFHALLIDVNGRQYAKEYVSQAMLYLARIRYIAIQTDDHPLNVVQEHERLLDAIVKSDVTAAEKEMKDHIYKGYHAFLAGEGFQKIEPYIQQNERVNFRKL